jgi:antirestriction protein ArdC
MPKAPAPAPSFAKLLDDAVNQPGVLSAAYEAFHNYSGSNCLLAIFECMRRKLEIGPLNTFRGWQKLGRQVRKGEKAITLCMPVTWKQKKNRYHDPGDDTPREDEIVSLRRRFIFRPFWFVLGQTDGEPVTPLCMPDWEEQRALYQLHIDRVSFVHPDVA